MRLVRHHSAVAGGRWFTGLMCATVIVSLFLQLILRRSSKSQSTKKQKMKQIVKGSNLSKSASSNSVRGFILHTKPRTWKRSSKTGSDIGSFHGQVKMRRDQREWRKTENGHPWTRHPDGKTHRVDCVLFWGSSIQEDRVNGAFHMPCCIRWLVLPGVRPQAGPSRELNDNGCHGN